MNDWQKRMTSASDRPCVDARVEPQAALVGAQGRVELDAETAVDVNRSGIVYPRHAEDDLALGLDDALQERVICVVGVLGDDGLQGLQNLTDRLVELGLATVAGNHGLEDGLQLLIHSDS